MGVTHSVELFDEQDSVSESGKSIISASLEHLEPPVTEQEIVEEFIRLLRYPVDPMTEAVLKSADVEEKSTEEFVVKVILDGKKLDTFKRGRGDGTDKVRNWKRVQVNKSRNMITIEDYVEEVSGGSFVDEASDKEVFCTTRLYVLSDPARLEFHVDTKDGTRLANSGLRDLLYIWTDNTVGTIQADKSAKVKVVSNAPSIKDKDIKSNVSEPMDDHVSYDNLFAYIVSIIKENQSKLPGASVTDVSEVSFVAECKWGEEGKESTMTNVVKFSAETGEIEISNFNDGKLAKTNHYVVHRSPLVVEQWGNGPDGDRITGEVTARQMQKLINRAIEKANSWFG